MPQELSEKLRQTIDRELPYLRALTDEQSVIKPASEESWSPRQELGHLIDSAVNNHVRFVRAATEPELHGPGYAQNAWVDIHAYHEMPWTTIIAFWYEYNSFLASLIQRIPADKLLTQCYIGTSNPVPLGFVIGDYVLHMQHHLDHLLSREVVTAYPAAAAATP
jgi:hypothetical protein